jgi:uncharacterized protein YndB with AHSA1/START domain
MPGTTRIIAEPGVPQIIITREFDAPPELLFRAYTEPDLLAQWLGPRQLTTVVEQFDLRHGGSWRYVQTDQDGSTYAFRGVFHGTPTAADGIVQTWEWEGMPGHIQLETITFEPQGQKTLVRSNAVFQSLEDRDGMVQSDMEVGVNEGNERLEELLARLAAKDPSIAR